MDRKSASYLANILAGDAITVQNLIVQADADEINDDILVRVVETQLISIEADIANIRRIMEG